MTGADPFLRVRGAVLLSWTLLLATLSAWQLSGPTSSGDAAILLLTVAPPLLPLPGLLRGLRRTYRWAALTLAPAMAWSLTEIVANPAARAVAAAAALLAFLSLAALIAALRVLPATR